MSEMRNTAVTIAAFQKFREKYPAVNPRIMPNNEEECIQMTAANGMLELGEIRSQLLTISSPPASVEEAKVHRNLWTVGLEEVPYALESCDYGRNLSTGCIKHTNLTGGRAAHCGGELWFLADDEIIINGASGRYGPKSDLQLREAGLAMKSCGYRVGCMKYDDDVGRPARIVVGEEDLEWL